MARILDKDTRIIDIDLGQIGVTATRNPGDAIPAVVTFDSNGAGQLISSLGAATAGGSFIQYSRVDLSYMTSNNEVMQPVDVSIQRTTAVPNGGGYNQNITDYMEEYIFVLTRPLNNQVIGDTPSFTTIYNPLRTLGLDGSQISGGGNVAIPGSKSGWPNLEQTIYAEKRMYGLDTSRIASVNNGILTDPRAESPPQPLVFNDISAQPVLTSQNTWGSMGAITGPSLHVYRMVIMWNQTFTGYSTAVNLTLDGNTSYQFPPVNVSFLCKDPSYSEGEYLTRLANAMNSTPERS